MDVGKGTIYAITVMYEFKDVSLLLDLVVVLWIYKDRTIAGARILFSLYFESLKCVFSSGA